MNIVAAKISQRRKELGLTQKELAEKLNISDKTLSRWETGKQIPDSLTIPEIAKVLDISINEIYGVDYCKTAHCRRRNQQVIFGIIAPADYAVSALTAF